MVKEARIFLRLLATCCRLVMGYFLVSRLRPLLLQDLLCKLFDQLLLRCRSPIVNAVFSSL